LLFVNIVVDDDVRMAFVYMDEFQNPVQHSSTRMNARMLIDAAALADAYARASFW
jgi:hypothetical protein